MNGVHCQVSAMIRLRSAESGLFTQSRGGMPRMPRTWLKSPKLGLKNDLK